MTDIQTIKDKIDIVQVIQEYLPMKKSGINWKGNCPFHGEKTPSFMVHPEKQIFHCFGCGEGGDVFTFVQKMEGMDFPEVLKLLANRAGITLDTNFKSEVNKSQKNRIIEINSKAAYFFHSFLLEMSSATDARAYLKNRGLKDETIASWQIGFIPDQWDLLTKYLLKKGFSIDDLLAAGISIKNEQRNSYYDRFRGRIMFPILDIHSNVVGFTGRVLVETENSGGKYINSPQTIVFDKSRVLYGLNNARMNIKSKDLAVVVEGQMDVVTCHEFGMTNVVASSGTALTNEQIKLLKRYSNNVAMAFDADQAGQNAAKRGIDLALIAGMNIKVIKIPDGCGKDADECIRKDGNAWLKAVEKASSIMDWYFKKVFSEFDLKNPRERQLASDMLLIEIDKIPYAVEREFWFKKLSEELLVDIGVLYENLKDIKQKNKVKTSYIDNKKTEKKEVEKKEEDKFDILIRKFWALAIVYPAHLSELIKLVKDEYFVDTKYLALYDFYKKNYNSNSKINFSEFESTEKEDSDLIAVLSLQAEKDFGDWKDEKKKEELGILLAGIKLEWRKKLQEDLNRQLYQAQKNGDKEKENEILASIIKITSVN